MFDKTLALSNEQKLKLSQISARQKAANEGFRECARAFAEMQSEALIMKETLFKEFCEMMGVDYNKLHADGLSVRVGPDNIARIVDLRPKKEEKKEGE